MIVTHCWFAAINAEHASVEALQLSMPDGSRYSGGRLWPTSNNGVDVF